MAYPPQLAWLAMSAMTAIAVHSAAPQYLVKESPWWTAAAIFFVQFTMFAIWRMLLYPFYLSPLRHLPTPPGASFPLGHMRMIIKEPTGSPHRRWLKTIPNDGLIRYLFYFNKERIFPASTKAYAEVLVTKSYDFIKPPLLVESLGRLLGPLGILFSEGDLHKQQRKMLNPAFSFRHIKELYPLFWSKAQEMVNTVSASLSEEDSSSSDEKGHVIQVDEWFSRATLDIIGEGGMSKSFNAIKDPNSELNAIYRRAFQPSRAQQAIFFARTFLPSFIVALLPIARETAIKEAATAIRAKCQEFIQEKKAAMSEKDADEKSASAGNDILTTALKAGGFTDEVLVDQLMTFLAAGHETTATAMSWALYTLCEHPEVQARLRDDLRAAGLPSDSTTPITAAQIESIPYLSAFCSELLRFQPPVPFTSRITRCDTSILGMPIPKGTPIAIVPMAVNRNPDFWGPDAEEFNPERWLTTTTDATTGVETVTFNGNGGAENNYATLTFLHGPRSCIGERFARAEFMCLVASWVLAFDSKATWETGNHPDDLQVNTGVTRKIKGGVTVRVTTPA